MQVEEGKIINLEYTITTDKGELIESSNGRGAPLEFVFGQSGLLPGLDEQLRGMGAGDEKDFDLPPDKAFGTIESGPTITIHRSQFPEDAKLEVGNRFQADLARNGQPVNFALVEVHDNDVLARLIHPLAGRTIHIKAKVLAVRDV